MPMPNLMCLKIQIKILYWFTETFTAEQVVCVAAYAHQLETLLTEKIDALTKFRGEFCARCCSLVLAAVSHCRDINNTVSVTSWRGTGIRDARYGSHAHFLRSR